jgi:cold shock CspA family protein
VKGSVKFFNTEKAYGFIVPDNPAEGDVFFHVRQCVTQCAPPEGAAVEYEIERTQDGRTRACRVRRI